jgi:hypothetical protein
MGPTVAVGPMQGEKGHSGSALVLARAQPSPVTDQSVLPFGTVTSVRHRRLGRRRLRLPGLVSGFADRMACHDILRLRFRVDNGNLMT